jgi:hypothetical protein
MSVKLDWDPAELLATDPIAEPIEVAGVRIHGGLSEDGRYVSPRNRYRTTAIKAWQANIRASGGELPAIGPDSLAPQVPTLEQMKFLLDQGVSLPFLATLTRVGIVEGYGGMLRYLIPENVQQHFVEDVSSTAIGHLAKGLIEAHARDESGFDDEAGHSRMWPLARDLAFPSELSREDTKGRIALALERANAIVVGNSPEGQSLPPVDPQFLELLNRLVSVLIIEIRAYLLFEWAQALFDYTKDEADSEWPTRIVSFIRQDETPHVEYIKTVLGELSLLTLKGTHGERIDGGELAKALLDLHLDNSRRFGRERNLRMAASDLATALEGRADAGDILAGLSEFDGGLLADYVAAARASFSSSA